MKLSRGNRDGAGDTHRNIGLPRFISTPSHHTAIVPQRETVIAETRGDSDNIA
ncbi:MAG TPA: hypothetical protein VFZ59_17745 [Verrucomicrobiae bacterium]|nr:hypothetical protein [Verrucomicrobiae bacterium]